jgi:hypothetical protein
MLLEVEILRESWTNGRKGTWIGVMAIWSIKSTIIYYIEAYVEANDAIDWLVTNDFGGRLSTMSRDSVANELWEAVMIEYSAGRVL